jgi:poly(A) polymerase
VRLDPRDHAWMTAAPTRAVMAALGGDEDCARFVGGAVRNALLGVPVIDVDIATQFTPDDVVRRLHAAKLRAVATGIEHGTVTAIADGTAFEVTSLRRDVETFGRRAVVAFTTEWTEDALRRDFTINALYASADGNLFDYFNGLEDIAARRVRFIGDANQRIREDYLRILRFFRFYAWYGRGAPDTAAMAACVAEKSGIKLLSGERVQKELLLLVQAQNPVPVLTLMQENGISEEFLPVELHTGRVERLIGIEREIGAAPDALLRFAALLPDSAAQARGIGQTLRLSNEARDRIVAAAERDRRIAAPMPPALAKQLLYRNGVERFHDQLLLNWAGSGASPADSNWRAIFSLMQSWKIPQLPVDGNDVMALGIPEGPEIGVRLRDVEQWWIEQDFAAGRMELLDRLRVTVHKPR